MCAFLQIKDRKHIEQNFHPVAGFMPQGWDLGCWVGQNLSVGICDGAPSTAHSSLSIFFLIFFFLLLFLSFSVVMSLLDYFIHFSFVFDFNGLVFMF